MKKELTEKQKRIDLEEKRITALFKGLAPKNNKLFEKLVKNAAFMGVVLEDLQKEILEKGAVITCMTGNGYETTKDNPAFKAYTTMIARYSSVITQLSDLLPSEKASELTKAGESLSAFIVKGKPSA